MATFGRRRRGIDEPTASAGATEAEARDDDAIRVIEGLFAEPRRSRHAPVTARAAHVSSGAVLLPSDAAPEPQTPERGTSLSRISTTYEGETMAQLEQSVQELLTIDGAVGVAIVDSASGMALAQGGHPAFDLGVAAAGNSNVVRAKLQTMKDLGLHSTIDDILITLDEQYHLINVLGGAGAEGLFVYLVLDRSKANLALARHRLANVSGHIIV